MHFVSRIDGLDYVVVLDGLALSSWCLPDEVVSKPDIHASSDGFLSTDGKGRFVLAWDDGYNMSHLYTVDGLERVRRYPRFKLKPSFLDASGKGLLRLGGSYSPSEIEHCNLKGESKARQELPFPKQFQTILRATPDAPAWSQSRSVGRGGLVGLVDDEGFTLLVDFRDFKTPKVLASAVLGIPPSWDVELTCLDQALGVIAHDVPNGKATAWVLSGEDVLEKQEGLAALTMPSFASRDSLLLQVSDAELALVSLRDGSARTFRLPELGRETQLDPRGPGTPIADSGVVAFLPWHRESLLTFDLETGEPAEVSRMLPEDQQELRRFILQKLRVANESVRSTGTRFELRGLECSEKSGRYSVSFSAHEGEGSLWVRLVMGVVNGLYTELQGRSFGRWQLGSVSNAILPADTCPTTDADEVAALLERVDRYGFRLSSLLPFLEQFYEHETDTWSATLDRFPLTDEGAVLMLQAFFAWFSAEAPVALAPRVAQWRKAPASVAELAAQVPHFHASHASVEPRLLTPLARMAAVHFQEDAGPLLLALAVEAHPDHLNNTRHELLQVLAWWAGKHPKAAKALAKTVTPDEVRAALAVQAQ